MTLRLFRSLIVTGLLLGVSDKNNSSRLGQEVAHVLYNSAPPEQSVYTVAKVDTIGIDTITVDTMHSKDIVLAKSMFVSRVSQASIMDIEGLFKLTMDYVTEAKGVSSSAADALNMQQEYLKDGHIIPTLEKEKIPKKSSKHRTTKGPIYIVGSDKSEINYLELAEKSELNLDIYLADSTLEKINTQNKIDIPLKPNNNLIHIGTRADLDMLILFILLGGDDGRNVVSLNSKISKVEYFSADRWLEQIGKLREFACKYMDDYDDVDDILSKKQLFERYYVQMPGAMDLFMQSFGASYPELASNSDYELWYKVCKRIKKETKNLRMLKVGRRIGF